MPESFDTVVIGSSPMLLLVALAEREAGKRVCVVDKSVAVGGVWRTVHAGEGIEVEYACHLVEDFPGIYEYLERASGVTFSDLDVQPIRVLPSGARFRYSSRTTLLLGAVWSAGMILRHWTRAVFGAVTEHDRERLVVLQQKLVDFLRHHLGLLVRGSVIKAPVYGYADFIHAMKSRCEEAGVSFRTFDVRSASIEAGRWMLMDGRGDRITGDSVHATTSATLQPAGDTGFTAYPVPVTVTRSVLVEIPHDQVRERVSYAAFWDDSQVVRISRIDQRVSHPGGLLYLVQLGKGAPVDGVPLDLVVDRLRKCGVIHVDGSARIVDEIQCTRVPHDHQLKPGCIAPGFHAHRSAGNLASGIARWLSGGGDKR